MTELRRGFKTEANAHAVAVRREMNLDVHAPLCPWQLAEFLEIPVVPLSTLESIEPEAVRYLSGVGRKYLSAVTIFVGRRGKRRIVFHNDGHARTRQVSNLAHELAHALLCHPPSPPFIPDPTAEAEAEWFGPTLLIPEEAALHIVRQKMPHEVAADFYGVSRDLLKMRINVTGANIRVQRKMGA